ncbi:MAG TPA: VOC family protein [Candidatus Cybelea sp.]|jgi:uncharacterized glyoxalase superfamily protein PhnB|nr:VOC family protein [Candidatus Cybelea sp.]
MQTIYPGLRYNDAKAAIEWLESAFGFETQEVYTADDGSVVHAQLRLAGNLVMLGNVKDDSYGTSPATLGAVTGTIYIALGSAGEIDACYGRAKAAGVEIIRELSDTDYGSHDFGARDLEGHIWSFGTYRPQAS